MSTRHGPRRIADRPGHSTARSARPIIVASKTNQVDLGAQPAAPIAYGYLKRPDPDEFGSGPAVLHHVPRQAAVAPRFGFAWRPFG